MTLIAAGFSYRTASVAGPRDVDPAVADVPGASLVEIDDLQSVSEANLRLLKRVGDGPDSAETVRWLFALEDG